MDGGWHPQDGPIELGGGSNVAHGSCRAAPTSRTAIVTGWRSRDEDETGQGRTDCELRSDEQHNGAFERGDGRQPTCPPARSTSCAAAVALARLRRARSGGRRVPYVPRRGQRCWRPN
eukprot:scaffold93614_cov28-Tisochrysis_lutea.AAC.3